MTDHIFRFSTDLRCHLADGSSTTLRNFEVVVETNSLADAQERVLSIATEMVYDQGSRLLDAPLDRLEVVRSHLIRNGETPI